MERKEKRITVENVSRLMIATKAHHKLGDLSRNNGDVAVITSEDGKCFIGHWLEGFGLINVKFPKSTTRELTPSEKRKLNGKVYAVGSHRERITFAGDELQLQT